MLKQERAPNITVRIDKMQLLLNRYELSTNMFLRARNEKEALRALELMPSIKVNSIIDFYNIVNEGVVLLLDEETGDIYTAEVFTYNFENMVIRFSEINFVEPAVVGAA